MRGDGVSNGAGIEDVAILDLMILDQALLQRCDSTSSTLWPACLIAGVLLPWASHPSNPAYRPPEQARGKSLALMIPVNGVIVDMRMMPRELQEQAYELGLIPFIPD